MKAPLRRTGRRGGEGHASTVNEGTLKKKGKVKRSTVNEGTREGEEGKGMRLQSMKAPLRRKGR
jgi:hypothetical protein